MQPDLTLRLPEEAEEEEFLRAHRATSPEVPSFLHYYEEGMPFRRYLERLVEQEHGVNLPSTNHVPSTFLLRSLEAESWSAPRSGTHSMTSSIVSAGTSATSWCQSFDDVAMPPRFFVSRCTSPARSVAFGEFL